MKTIISLLTLSLFCSLSLTAQLNSVNSRTWNQQNGLSANVCLNVMQDRSGYIWISTINGICRFNGINFKEIARYNDSVPIQGRINQIIQDEDGIFWIASFEKGLLRLDLSLPEGRQVEAFNGSTLPGQVAPPNYSLTKILDDSAGNIWVGTIADGLFRFDKAKRKFTRWTLKNPATDYPNHIRSLYLRDKRTIWVGTINGITYIDIKTGKIYYPKTTYTGVTYAWTPTVRSFCHWNKDTFAVATDRGPHLYCPGSETFTPLFSKQDSAEYKLKEYHEVFKVSDKELWFATIDRGILIVNPNTRNCEYSWKNNSSLESVGRLPVYQIVRDKSNDLWICHSQGLTYLNHKSARFNNAHFNFSVSQPLRRNLLSYENNQLSTIRGDSLFIREQDGHLQPAIALTLNKKRIFGENIWHHKKLGRLFLNGGGIFTWNSDDQKVSPVILKNEFPEELLPVPAIVQIVFDTIKGKEFWWMIIDRNHSLYRYDCEKKTFTSYDLVRNCENKVDSNLHFSQLRKDAQNGIWISTLNEGIFYMPDKSADKFIHFGSNEPPGRQIPGNYAADIVFDNNRVLWASIHGKGLIRLSLQKENRIAYTIYGKNNGLAYSDLNELQVDNFNNIWAGSLNGLHRFDQNKKWFSAYGHPDGISNSMLTFSTAKDNSGKLYFASTDHLLSFQPKEFLNEKASATLGLQAVVVNDRRIKFRNGQMLTLKPHENNLRFEFDILDYEHPSGHYIQCKLEGYDKDWILLQDVFQQSYNMLPGGKYIFRLRNVGMPGPTGEAMTLPISISRNFYETTEFAVLLTVLGIIIALAGVRIYTNQKLRKQRELIDKKQAIDLERLRISAELHDDVGGELSAIRILSEMANNGVTQNSKEYLSRISASSADLVQKMNEIVWALNIKNDSLVSLMLYTGSFASAYLDTVGIHCSLSYPEKIPVLEMDGIIRRNIFLLVKEAVHNIVKHADATRVSIRMSAVDYLEICIHDNGKGIDLAQMTQFGNGLSTMAKRAKDVKGSLQILNDNGSLIIFRMDLSAHTKV